MPCIHTHKQHYKHTPYPTHLKLTVNNKDQAYAEQLIPHSQCVVMYQLVLQSVQSH
jgi:hypothetical protein